MYYYIIKVQCCLPVLWSRIIASHVVRIEALTSKQIIPRVRTHSGNTYEAGSHCVLAVYFRLLSTKHMNGVVVYEKVASFYNYYMHLPLKLFSNNSYG